MLALQRDNHLEPPPTSVPSSPLRWETTSFSSEQPAEPSLSSSCSTPSHRSSLVSPTDSSFPRSATLTRRTSRFGSISFPNPFASTSSFTSTTYRSYEDSYDAPKDTRRKSSSNRMTQIFHRKSGSTGRANSVDVPSSKNVNDEHRPTSYSAKRNSISNVKGNLHSLFHSSAPSSDSSIKQSPASKLPPSSYHPAQSTPDASLPPKDGSLAIGAYSIQETRAESASVAAAPRAEWVPPILQTGYVSRTDSAEGPMGEQTGGYRRSEPVSESVVAAASPPTSDLLNLSEETPSSSTFTPNLSAPLSFTLPQSTVNPIPSRSPTRPLIDLSFLQPTMTAEANTTTSTPSSRRSNVQVPSILSPNLSSYSFGTPSFGGTPVSSYFPSSTTSNASPRTTSSTPFYTPSGSSSGAPHRPNFSARKSSVSALPRATPMPMPIANLPTLPTTNVTSPNRPENPRKAVRDMPKVFINHGPVEEEEDGGDAGDGSDSSSDESDTDSEGIHAIAGGSGGGVVNGHVKAASASSISVDSIVEESEAEGSSRNGAVSPTTPPELSSSLADRRHIAAPHLSLNTPPTAFHSSNSFSSSFSKPDRFASSSWSLSTPSAETVKPVGSWATFSLPTPGATPGAFRGSRTRPSSSSSSAEVKTPGILEKGRTPRARASTGDSGYFDIREAGPTEAGKTPTQINSKGKGRMGSMTMTMAAPSDDGDVGRITSEEESGMETTTDSEAEQHSPASSPEIEEPQPRPTAIPSHLHSPRSASTPDASSHPADFSFVMVDPPTPGASSRLRSQESFRPSLYHQASRSLVNLSSAVDRRMDHEREQERESFRGLMNTNAGTPTSGSPITVDQADVFGSRGATRAFGVAAGVDGSALRSPPPLFSPSIHSVTPKAFPLTISTATPGKPSSGVSSTSATPTAGRQRRRSMTDATHIPPPEYSLPAFNSGIPRPRDEEGKEGLPVYRCSVHIEGYLPRKMEFSSPGVQAKDRAWKRQYFVLHGTCLKVYKHDVRQSPVRTGSGEYSGDTRSDVDNTSAHVHLPGVPSVSDARPPPSASASSHTIGTGSGSSLNIAQQNARRGSDETSLGNGGRRGSLAAVVANAASSSRRGSVDLTATSGGSPRRGSVDTERSRARSVSSDTRGNGYPGNSSSSSLGGSSTSTGVTEPDSEKALFDPATSSNLLTIPAGASPYSSNSHAGGPKIAFHGSNALVKSYTLQGAESGLAADYLKKKNVVRVRLMGEQFLLQADSPKDVVDWIEAFQAGTNVSMDLDDRQMPKIITLPRRRRRRPAAAAASTTGDALPSTVEDTAEANIAAAARIDPSILGGSRTGGGSAVDAMEAMLGEDQQGAPSSAV